MHHTIVIIESINLLPSPAVGYRGPSQIPGAGSDLFIYHPAQDLLPGTVIADYWGPDTDNGGLPESIDQGAYLLQSDDYMVALPVQVAISIDDAPSCVMH